ncbi:hypothetical protein EB796_024707 [Bugula neritina]|uniref:Uncharacterized protein n=1 Tax=Bugula neritina TaxID=10212 RepID=A0A7J7ITZ5_BUGNE|nr:hypothetical protein EB796_024707 [Bugula neritina]
MSRLTFTCCTCLIVFAVTVSSSPFPSYIDDDDLQLLVGDSQLNQYTCTANYGARCVMDVTCCRGKCIGSYCTPPNNGFRCKPENSHCREHRECCGDTYGAGYCEIAEGRRSGTCSATITNIQNRNYERQLKDALADY